MTLGMTLQEHLIMAAYASMLYIAIDYKVFRLIILLKYPFQND